MNIRIVKNIFKICNSAWRYRYTIVLPTLIMPIVGFLVSFLAPSHYESHTTILLQDTTEMNPILEDFSVSTNLEERQQALKILLKSRTVLKSVIYDLGYVTEQSTNAEIDREISKISSSLSVAFGGELIKISYNSKEKTDIKKILETVTKHLIQLILAPNKSWQNTSMNFLNSQVDTYKQELYLAEKKLSEYKTTHALELPEIHKANVTRLTELSASFADKKSELAGAEASLSEFNKNLAHTNPIVGKLEENIIKIKTELSMLKSRYTEQHSQVQAAIRELNRLQQERQKIINASEKLSTDDVQRLWNLASSTAVVSTEGNMQSTTILASQLQAVQEANSIVTSLRNEVDYIQQQIETLRKKVYDFSEIERSLSTLTRDVEIKKKLYDDFKYRQGLAQVTSDLIEYEEGERVKVIDKPFNPTIPIKIPAIIFIIAGIFAGIGIGTAIAAISEITDTTLRLIDDLEQAYGIPVIVRIPKIADGTEPYYDSNNDNFKEEIIISS